MKKTRTIRTAVAAGSAAIAVASTTVVAAAPASAWWPFDAQGPAIQKFGTRAELVDGDGTIVQGWTVRHLKPSTDAIPNAVTGRLWEAEATDEAIKGTVSPIISNMNARAADGETYRAIFTVPLEKGLNPATLAQGQKTTGKLYFDVTGQDPDGVVYNNLVQDLLIWVE